MQPVCEITSWPVIPYNIAEESNACTINVLLNDWLDDYMSIMHGPQV